MKNKLFAQVLQAMTKYFIVLVLIVMVGIAASGRTPYVLGCMEYAKELGAPTVSVTCCPGSVLDNFADIGIAPCPGPEVITGSTRMKSGTAQKMVLNMLSTCAMIKTGKVYENMMINLKPSNKKLRERIVADKIKPIIPCLNFILITS